MHFYYGNNGKIVKRVLPSMRKKIKDKIIKGLKKEGVLFLILVILNIL